MNTYCTCGHGASFHNDPENPDGCLSLLCECDGRAAWSDTVNRSIEPRFDDILHEIRETHVRKSAEYGTREDHYANIRASAAWGMPAWVCAAMRATDKATRLQSLVANGQARPENAREWLLEIANYAIICAVMLDEEDA